MAKNLLTTYLKRHTINQIRESITEPANNSYYLFAAKHTSYSTGDEIIPTPINSVQENFYTPYKEMIFGKRITSNDIKVGVKKYVWTSNTIYQPYRSDIDLADKKFYVVVEDNGYHVFKCLDNNGGAASTVQPTRADTSANDAYYSTSDSYVWKWMYSIDQSTYNKFTNDLYIPVIPDQDVVGNAVSGSIDVITISYPGSNYNTYFTGTFTATDLRIGGDRTKYALAATASSLGEFYTGSFLYIVNGTGIGQGRKIISYQVVGVQKIVTLESEFDIDLDATSQYEITPFVTVIGDGSGARARALVNTTSSNSIYKVEIISKGNSYTYASCIITGNQSGISNSAIVSPVLSPKGGHGSDPEIELDGKVLILSVDFNKSETGNIPTTNDYRKIGVLKDPLYANVNLTITTPSEGIFTVGEIVEQGNGARGKVAAYNQPSNLLTLTDVLGDFVATSGNSSLSITGANSSAVANVVTFVINGEAKNFTTFDQRWKFTFDDADGTFQEDSQVSQIQANLIANGIVHSVNATSNVLYITDMRGVLNTGERVSSDDLNASANLLSAIPPDLVEGSGEILYIENQYPVSRNDDQTETIKLLLTF